MKKIVIFGGLLVCVAIQMHADLTTNFNDYHNALHSYTDMIEESSTNWRAIDDTIYESAEETLFSDSLALFQAIVDAIDVLNSRVDYIQTNCCP